MTWQLFCGDARSVLSALPDESVNCIVTSPPYWGLRDYGHAEQIGLEPSPESFVAALAGVFAEARRVLRDDGTVWLNLGDSYTSIGRSGRKESPGVGAKQEMRSIERDVIWAKRDEGDPDAHFRWTLPGGQKQKDLIGIPWRVAFALQSAGWYLRADIIWSKPNPMPESVRDRVTKAHEYVFMLTKAPRYYYDQDAIREAYAPSTLREFQQPYESDGRKDYAEAGVQNPSSVKARIVAKGKQAGHGRRQYDGFNARWTEDATNHGGSNARSVWTIPTEASPYEHFAVMPKALARKCIMAGCPSDGTVLDPFAGVATTGVIALEEGRNFVGIELNPTYHAMARERLEGVAPLLAREVSA